MSHDVIFFLSSWHMDACNGASCSENEWFRQKFLKSRSCLILCFWSQFAGLRLILFFSSLSRGSLSPSLSPILCSYRPGFGQASSNLCARYMKLCVGHWPHVCVQHSHDNNMIAPVAQLLLQVVVRGSERKNSATRRSSESDKLAIHQQTNDTDKSIESSQNAT